MAHDNERDEDRVQSVLARTVKLSADLQDSVRELVALLTTVVQDPPQGGDPDA